MKSIKTKIGHLKMKRSKNSKNFLIKKLLFTKQRALKKYRIYLKTKTIRPLIQSLRLNATYSPAILSFLKEGNNGRISGDYIIFITFLPNCLIIENLNLLMELKQRIKHISFIHFSQKSKQ